MREDTRRVAHTTLWRVSGFRGIKTYSIQGVRFGAVKSLEKRGKKMSTRSHISSAPLMSRRGRPSKRIATEESEVSPKEVICLQATFEQYGGIQLRLQAPQPLLEASKRYEDSRYGFCRTCSHRERCREAIRQYKK